jgi:hypothetical protein
MSKRNHLNPRLAPQLPMTFTTRKVLDQKRRKDVLAQLSRLLLQAAGVHGGGTNERS